MSVTCNFLHFVHDCVNEREVEKRKILGVCYVCRLRGKKEAEGEGDKREKERKYLQGRHETESHEKMNERGIKENLRKIKE